MASVPPSPVTPADRLAFTVIVALLAHALVVFGIHFVQPVTKSAPTLEVTLVAAESKHAPKRADFLAQAQQEGSGTLEEARLLSTRQRTALPGQGAGSQTQPAAPGKAPAEAAHAKGFFAVALDPYTYGALFYMLLSLATGVFYFTWISTGLSLSVGLSVLIIGIPFFILFMASVYAISLLEGRLVETLLGVRMPRRPVYRAAEAGWTARIKALLTDARTWLSLLYMALMLPLGMVYFTLTVTLLSVSLSLIAAPLLWWMGQAGWLHFNVTMGDVDSSLASPVLFIAGVLGFFASLHLIRLIGRWHGRFAKHLLVESGVE